VLAVVAALCLTIGTAFSAYAQAPAAQDAAKPQYTMAEYNAYQAAQATRDPAQQIKQLDDFVAKYPNSALLIYIYPLYYNAYSQQKNWAKVAEYADKLLAMGDKADAPFRLFRSRVCLHQHAATQGRARRGRQGPGCQGL
jgi:tetratricopeptide (TPR) repeat protein